MDTKNSVRTKTVALLAAIAALVGSAIVAAGPLDPPAGPISSTPGPEPRTAINTTNTPGDADSLFKITQPGSYYLTRNITGVAGKHGIEIAASGVTLDLNGFDLVGVPGMGAFDGVNITVNNLVSIAVINGSVRGWGGDGVDLATTNNSSTCALTNVRAVSNAGHGVYLSKNCTITGCAAAQNGLNGFYASGDGNTFLNCTASLNTGYGFNLGSATVQNCSAFNNLGTGFFVSAAGTLSGCSSFNNTLGIEVNLDATITDCSVFNNSQDGIRCSVGCLIRGNASHGNGSFPDGAAIHVLSVRNRIEGNNCTNAVRGIDVDAPGNFIVRNSCSGNTVDWDIAANNIFGPIIDRRNPSNSSVSGFSAISSLNSTDANANFSY